ncbi:MAG: hypothetical protein AAB225_10310 [Acidobacteriota bacterium]
MPVGSAARAEIFESVAGRAEARTGEGRELAIESRRAGLSLAQARHHILLLEGWRRQAEARRGAVLGLDPGDQVRLAEEEAAQLRVEIRSARGRIASETRELCQVAAEAESAGEVARLDLEVARDQVSLLLARMGEGRAGLKQVEEARFAEAEKWIVFYEVASALELARLHLLERTGALMAALLR